jgi:hypothetical protein
MFRQLRLEVMDRFAAIQHLVRESHQKLDTAQLQAIRGMAFVQVYAAYEYTVKNVVRRAGESIAVHQHPLCSIKPSLMAMFLHPQLQSVQDSPRESQWDSRIALFERVCSDEVATSVPVVPSDGSHFKQTHLRLIFRVLGLTCPPTSHPRHLGRIDEVVLHRHAIAHGNETAENIGSRYTEADIDQVISQVQDVCLYLISAVEGHCSNPATSRR